MRASYDEIKAGVYSAMADVPLSAYWQGICNLAATLIELAGVNAAYGRATGWNMRRHIGKLMASIELLPPSRKRDKAFQRLRGMIRRQWSAGAKERRELKRLAAAGR